MVLALDRLMSPILLLLMPLDQGLWGQRVLDLLRLQRRGQLQRQQDLYHVVTVRRRRALAAGALGHLSSVEEVVALQDEALDHGLVQFGGG